jgi:fatty-acyl-CoA synthase
LTVQNSMQDWPLTVDRILDHAKAWFPDQEVVSRSVEGPIVRTTYSKIHERAKRLSNALLKMGVQKGDRIATMAWNTANHMECWYGIMGIGAVCHTLNPRLFAEQLCYIINHAEDQMIFTDLSFGQLLADHRDKMPTVKHFIVLCSEAELQACPIAGSISYETLLAQHAPEAEWGNFDEKTPAGLCYTSGTTGNPKGVLYTHRSNFLHSMAGISPSMLNMSDTDVMLPVVPLFHANAWGLAFNCPAVGCKMVLPGPKLDGASVYELMETEGVTYSAGVPTVWQMLLQHMDTTSSKFSTLKTLIVGGSALPEAILRGFHDRYNVEVIAAWGMTETSPLATTARLTPAQLAMPYDQQVPYRIKAGRPPIGVELKVVDENGVTQPNDGHSVGRLMVKGVFVVQHYYRAEDVNILDDEGFFDTGDVATLDKDGFVTITDRAKDVIKSGGEWISSIEIENIAVGHPTCAIAAVIGVPHPKWDERPILLVKLKPGHEATAQDYLQFLEGKIAKWWTPDAVEFVDDIPLGATGKIDKKVIRGAYAKYVLPSLADE